MLSLVLSLVAFELHVVQPLHWFGSVGLVEHAMWLRLACYSWFDCLGLIEHTRWLRLACYAGLVASVWLNMQGGGDLHAVLV